MTSSDIKPATRPTRDQERAIRQMQDFYEPLMGGADFFLLSGYAGTGKTFAITEFVKGLEVDAQVILTAPTNKAVRVLDAMAERAGLKVETATIHSLLGLVLGYEKDKQILKKNRASTLSKYDLVIVDECSMIGESLWHYIEEGLRNLSTQVIFVGDPLQLPPVGEVASPTFSIENRADLNQIIRQQAGNPIIELSAAIRNIMETGGRLPVRRFLSEPGSKSGLFLMPDHRFEKWFPGAFKQERYRQDRDAFRVVSWTNRKVNYFNDTIRSFLVDRPSNQPFLPGERAVTADGVHIRIGQSKTKLVLNTDSEGEVLQCDKTIHPWHEEPLTVWETRFQPFDTEAAVTLYLPDPSTSHQVQARLKRLAEQARAGKKQWWDFWNLRNSLADLRPCHAITVHRSQGSTFSNVFVDSENILANPNRQEALQCLYVAVTRASDCVVLNTPLI
ncbi:MAG: AAA family ATPase [Magnetococcales bacterium]|nr:AAA family ATPase [Magnetococcales bacterium]